MAEVVKTVYIIIFSSVGVSFPRWSGTMTHLKLGWKMGHDLHLLVMRAKAQTHMQKHRQSCSKDRGRKYTGSLRQITFFYLFFFYMMEKWGRTQFCFILLPIRPIPRLAYHSQSAIYISVPVTSVILDNDESNPLHGRQLLCHYH